MPGNSWRPMSPQRAREILQSKLLLQKQDLEKLGHVAYTIAWTVARVAELRVLEALRQALVRVIEEGGTLDDWTAALDNILDTTGWGTSPWHAETIMRTTIGSVYESERFAYLRGAQEVEWLVYDAINDDRVRPEHLELDGLAYPREEFPEYLWPPNGYNCRCTVVPALREDLADLGAWTPTWEDEIPEPDPGFSHPPTVEGASEAVVRAAEIAYTKARQGGIL